MSENQNTPKKFSSKMIAGIGAAAVILIAVIAGIGIYNTPANRAARALDLGNRYLEEQNYEQAAIAFEEVITIDDRCMEAYAGGVLAYQQLGDQERLTDIYERALSAVAGLDETELAKNMETVVGIYLTAEVIYGNDPARVIEILEDGFRRTGDQRIKDKLVEYYLELANTYESTGNIDMAAQALMDGYEKTGDEWLLEEWQNLTLILEYMQQIYDLIAAEDYEGMCDLQLINGYNLSFDHYIYIPDNKGSLTGLGVGLYKYEGDENEGNWNAMYYFYGNYKDGIREGTGTSIAGGVYDGFYEYEVFSGEWKNDMPNGEGILKHYGTSMSILGWEGWSCEMKGNLVNGLFDGHIEADVSLPDYFNYSMSGYHDFLAGEHHLDFTVVNGIPEDKTDEYIEKYNEKYNEIKRNWFMGYNGFIDGFTSGSIPSSNMSEIIYAYTYIADAKDDNREIHLESFGLCRNSELLGATGFTPFLDFTRGTEVWELRD